MKFKPLDQAFDKQGSEATRTERKRFKLSTLSELHRLSQDFHKLVESKRAKAKRNKNRYGEQVVASSKEIVMVTYRVVATGKSLRALKKSLRVVVTSKSLRALKKSLR
ncbi:hypothetical protein Taro_006762 [Colocasia esculenta]|uniref:Uncharacterized protein n=1 Tax=Colocasia esculenta TaxID=4460 RepID=A0A843TWZ8_COLES|nr:hypothetical protein [Colocasia esculenta]